MPEPQEPAETVEAVSLEDRIQDLKLKQAQEPVTDSDTEGKEPLESGGEEVLKAAEDVDFDMDSYNFDAFIGKMKHPSCRVVLEQIKQ